MSLPILMLEMILRRTTFVSAPNRKSFAASLEMLCPVEKLMFQAEKHVCQGEKHMFQALKHKNEG